MSAAPAWLVAAMGVALAVLCVLVVVLAARLELVERRSRPAAPPRTPAWPVQPAPGLLERPAAPEPSHPTPEPLGAVTQDEISNGRWHS